MYLIVLSTKVIKLTIFKIVIITIVFVGVAVYEVRGIVKEKLYRELWTFSFLLLIGFVLTISYSLGFRIQLPVLPGLILTTFQQRR